jgi:hypothetical protein
MKQYLFRTSAQWRFHLKKRGDKGDYAGGPFGFKLGAVIQLGHFRIVARCEGAMLASGYRRSTIITKA